MGKIITITSDVPNDNGDEVKEGRTLVLPRGIDEDGDVQYVRFTYDASDEAVASLVEKAWRSLPKPLRDLIEGDPERSMIVAEPGAGRPARSSSRSGSSTAERAHNRDKREKLNAWGWDVGTHGRIGNGADEAWSRYEATGEAQYAPGHAPEGEGPDNGDQPVSGDNSGQDEAPAE